MEDLERMKSVFWLNKSVFITGHTGFKGGWLSLWLNLMGANVHGYSLDPKSVPSLFNVADIAAAIASDVHADLMDLGELKSALKLANPEIIFHLAAQSLVRHSYVNPLETFSTNIIGTANLLEAVREVTSVRAIVVVTTDKVYENFGKKTVRKENDSLGGRDPYSASKAATEIITASYRSSFYATRGGHPAQIATARAGNVIGGGDWATDRLLPDCLRSFSTSEPVKLRYPGSIRPWQHVLEPLSGYLNLGQELLSKSGKNFAKAWNFGPNKSDCATVNNVVEKVAHLWGIEANIEIEALENIPHEASTLEIDSELAKKELDWCPQWNLDQALDNTVTWYQKWLKGAKMKSVCEEQIKAYTLTK